MIKYLCLYISHTSQTIKIFCVNAAQLNFIIIYILYLSMEEQ